MLKRPIILPGEHQDHYQCLWARGERGKQKLVWKNKNEKATVTDIKNQQRRFLSLIKINQRPHVGVEMDV